MKFELLDLSLNYIDEEKYEILNKNIYVKIQIENLIIANN